jgi:hypothetical protein
MNISKPRPLGEIFAALCHMSQSERRRRRRRGEEIEK